MARWAIVVHGGCGRWRPADAAAPIALDHRVRVGVAMRGGRMPHAWFVEGARRVVARMC